MVERALPWLSVIIPTHDGERWLADTLGSLADQSEQGFECIVIDSSPSNSTIEIVDRFADRLVPRIYRRPDLDNWRTKTNFGFSQARSSHVCMLHQDDVWLPGRAAASKKWIESSPLASMHIHPAQMIDQDGKPLGILRYPLPAEQPICRSLLLDRLLVQNFVSVPTAVIRREAFLAVGGIDPTLWYTGDWDLYLKLAGSGDVFYHREVLAGFRIHGTSLTVSGSKNTSDFREQMITVLDRHGAGLSEGSQRAARVSIDLNVALAEANHGDYRALLRTLLDVVRLGPSGAAKFLRDARLIDRVLPRLRARARGRL